MHGFTAPNAIRFLVGEEVVTIGDPDPGAMLLPYLRRELGLTGAKEGCASGDCGACSVVLHRRCGDEDEHLAINSCIFPLVAANGHQVLTVEHLGSAHCPHPVQSTFAEAHGSQCGFCTPGFIMAIYAMTAEGGDSDHEALVEALSGNLCRCTGYRPILDAARKAMEAGHTAAPAEAIGLSERLPRAIPAVAATGELTDYHAPIALEDACRILHERPGLRILAGGTDLALEATQSLKPLPKLLYLGRVAELREIREDAEGIRIGAAVTFAEAEGVILRRYPGAADLLKRIGSRQIRNVGTLGGSLGTASPIGDLAPLLLALDAEIELASIAGTRVVRTSDFFLDYRKTARAPDEIISAMTIPTPAPGWSLKVSKVSKRIDDDISAVSCALAIRIEDGRVRDIRLAFGGMGKIPARAKAAEKALRDAAWTEQAIRRAAEALAEDFAPISDQRASAHYRMAVAGNLLLRLFHEFSGASFATRVTDHA